MGGHRQQVVDRLLQDASKLSDQEVKSISRVLVQCSFSQQIWHDILSKLNLLSCMPQADENFNTWFASAAAGASPTLQKCVKSLIFSPSGSYGILGMRWFSRKLPPTGKI
jgi:hypothetical protein